MQFSHYSKLKSFTAILLCSVTLTACTPRPETVAQMAQASIEEVLHVDPRFAGSNVEVIKVQVTEDGERKYKGIASIKHNDVVHEVPVDVLIDGLSIKWSTAPDAFSFIQPNKPPQ